MQYVTNRLQDLCKVREPIQKSLISRQNVKLPFFVYSAAIRNIFCLFYFYYFIYLNATKQLHPGEKLLNNFF